MMVMSVRERHTACGGTDIHLQPRGRAVGVPLRV